MNPVNSKQKRAVMGVKEAEVSDFLRAHPDFFERHLALLTELVIPHSARGRTVSLLERQVVALRDQLTIERKNLKGLVNAALDNTRLQQRLQKCFELIARSDDLHILLETLPSLLQAEFDLGVVDIRLLDGKTWPAVPVEHMIARDDSRTEALIKRLAGKRCLIEAPVSDLLISLLKNDSSFNPGSCAVLPMLTAEHSLIGWIVLVSEDRDHYRPDMDTVLLEGLGGLLSATTQRFRLA
ncbi:MAG: DUF484 family protein [Gammaproteobacteria bacterium]|nr:DUF484 family protein [Gammaproteobacteria bacterium]